MSHLSTHTSKLNDIDSIRSACEELGCQLKEGGSVRWYGKSTRADYVISWEGSTYDVGLVKDQKTGQFNLVYDTYTGQVENKLGKDCYKLIESSTYHRIAKKAKGYGFFLQKKENSEKKTIQVIMTRSSR